MKMNDWLKTALDPFHDYQLNLEGYPDSNGGLSVCQLFSAGLDIVSPVVPAVTWDCVVFNSAWQTTNNAVYAGITTVIDDGHVSYDSGIQRLPQNGSFGPVGGVMIISMPSGTPVYPLTVNHVVQLCATRTSLVDDGRLIAQAFEVTDATAQIYRQGSVCVGQYNSNSKELTVLASDVFTTTDGVADVWASHLPPITYNEAVVLPGSKTWLASKGCYVIPRLFTDDLPPAFKKSPGFLANTGADICQIGFAGLTGVAQQRLGISKFETGFAYFSGLSANATLRVAARSVTEFFPTRGSTLLSQATPSASYDPVALGLYAKIINTIPVGVPVSMNAAGDYFRIVVSAIKALAPALTLVPKVGPLLGAAAGMAGMMLPRRQAGPPAIAYRVNGKQNQPQVKKKKKKQVGKRF